MEISELSSSSGPVAPLPLGAGAAPPGRAKRSFLPEFADERNRQLDREIRALEAELEQAQISLDENEEHTQVLANHLDSVRLEIKHTQARLAARTREVEDEAHLREIAARESGKLRTDMARLRAERAEAAQRVTAMQTEVFKAGERMDQFKLVMNWNQEELEQWLEAARQKEEDSLALERYRRQDEARIKELTMRLERAAHEAQQGKRDLEDAITETQAAQTELGKAAQDFRRLHAERQELLQQWEGVLEAIKKRDAALLEAGKELAERNAKLAALKQELGMQAAELDAALAAGSATQKRILAREREIKGLYDAHGAAQAAAAEVEDQVDLLFNSLGRAADEAQKQAAASGHLRAELERRAAAVEAAQAKLEAARVRVQLEGQQLGSLQSKIQELERLRAEERQRATAIDKEVAALGTQQFRAAQLLAAAQEQERRLASEIGGAHAQGRNLSHRIAQLEEQLVRQQEVQYTADYQLVQMERKVARAEGHRSKDETEALNMRIKELEAQLEAAAKEQGLLAEEVRHAEDDYARAQRQSQAVQRERAAIMDDMARLTVEASAVGRAAKAAAREREGQLVEVDLWKLEVRRLRTLLGSKSGEVSELEARKRSLEAGMRERRSEVEMQLELMQGEARLLRDEVHRVTLELQARQLALQKLQKKHETLVLKSRSQDGEEAHSQAYYIIKAAQERQEMTEQAEELQAQIAKTEQECKALEATLRQLVGTNSDMHYHARHASAQGVLDEQAVLRQQLDRAMQHLKLKQAEEASRRQDLKEALARLNSVKAEAAGLWRRVEDLQRQRAEAQQQLAEQLERRQRAAQRAARLLKQLLAKGPGGCQLPGGMSVEALVTDIQLAQAREATKGLVEALRAAAAERPELNLLQRLECEAGVKLLAAEGSSRPASAARSQLCGSPAASRPASGRGNTPTYGSPRPASTAARGSAADSRPGSCAGGVSARSVATARGGSPAKLPAVQTVQLGL